MNGGPPNDGHMKKVRLQLIKAIDKTGGSCEVVAELEGFENEPTGNLFIWYLDGVQVQGPSASNTYRGVAPGNLWVRVITPYGETIKMKGSPLHIPVLQ